jgi:hypothetical protein
MLQITMNPHVDPLKALIIQCKKHRNYLSPSISYSNPLPLFGYKFKHLLKYKRIYKSGILVLTVGKNQDHKHIKA